MDEADAVPARGARGSKWEGRHIRGSRAMAWRRMLSEVLTESLTKHVVHRDNLRPMHAACAAESAAIKRKRSTSQACATAASQVRNMRYRNDVRDHGEMRLRRVRSVTQCAAVTSRCVCGAGRRCGRRAGQCDGATTVLRMSDALPGGTVVCVAFAACLASRALACVKRSCRTAAMAVRCTALRAFAVDHTASIRVAVSERQRDNATAFPM